MSNEEKKSPININADFTGILNASPKGAKYIFNILFGKKHAEAERRIRLSNAQDYSDMLKIVDGNAIYDPTSNELTQLNNTNLKSLIIDTIQEEEVLNILGCIKYAAPILNEANENKDYKEPTQDFINRWRNDAKLIDDETMRNVWGRILSEEINAPETVSLRSLDIIKNITKVEAQYFFRHY
ncbi:MULTISPECIES: DUF2806 domain-containing protein [unclassified Cedecea]|uniref:DUF2806 domain-containing protein n=1 Tax=unclassified Cedecea TaxID=2649846 RepID=UPI0030199CE8